MLILQGVTYTHPNGDLLFDNIDLALNKSEKVALIGNNGVGKSTLLKIFSGVLQPSQGFVKTDSKIYYVPQVMGQFHDHTVAQALAVDQKLNALKAILEGDFTETNMTVLDNDWAIEERCHEAFAYWKLDNVTMNQKLESLSGGQKTKVFLAGILIHQPDIVLLDEPSNHLDVASRKILYEYIENTTHTLMVVSHDRKLLNLLNIVYELDKRGLTRYGGNYDFYKDQKELEHQALQHELDNKEKELRKAKQTERNSLERQQKLNARGKKKQEKAGMPTIMMNTLRNNAERSTARLKDVHAGKVNNIAQALNDLRKEVPDIDKMKLDLDSSKLHRGKILVTATDINFRYNEHWLWKENLSFQIRSGERIAIEGINGSGKTTLINIIVRDLRPQQGSITHTSIKSIYIDQDYSLISNVLTIYTQAQQYNTQGLSEHEIKIRLNRYLFGKEDWDKPCSALSGGERMRLMLCMLSIAAQAPDIIILDEPTNNLDVQSIQILTMAIKQYTGTLLVISHDDQFLKEISIERSIIL